MGMGTTPPLGKTPQLHRAGALPSFGLRDATISGLAGSLDVLEAALGIADGVELRVGWRRALFAIDQRSFVTG